MTDADAARARVRKPGEPAIDYGAQPWRVTAQDEPNPDNPNATIRRARRRDPLRGMLSREVIEPAHFIAAERFRDAYELAQGARETTGSVRLEAWQRCHYAVRQADARQEVRDSLQAVGLRLSAVFVAAVVSYQPLRDIDRDLGIKSGASEDLLTEALDKLRDYQTATGR